MLSVRIEGLDELDRALREFADDVSNGLRRDVPAVLEEEERALHAQHPYTDRSGELTRKIKANMTASAPGGAAGVLEAGADHSSFVEEGTRPHVIRPRADRGAMGPLPQGQKRGRAKQGKRYLRFVGSGGNWVFARVVNHKGTKPRPFMGPAYHRMERKLIARAESTVAAAARKFDEK